jgi:drug/metabolite transporter (DMT)-like permease
VPFRLVVIAATFPLGTLMAIAFLGERFFPHHVVGIAPVAAGIVLTVRGKEGEVGRQAISF